MSKRQWVIVASAVVLLAVLVYVVAGPSDPPAGGETTDGNLDDHGLRAADGSRDDSSVAVLQGRAPAPGAAETPLPPPVDLEAADRERDLHGIVVRADGSPVAGAHLEARFYPWRYGRMLTDGQHGVSEERGATRSARDGTFSLRLTPGDHVHLRVEAEGLAPTELTMLQAGERVRVVLESPVTLTLRVKTPEGEPATGLALRVFRRERGDAWFQFDGETDATGTCHFASLPPGASIALDPRPEREGWGSPSWIRLELPEAGTLTHDLVLPEGRTLRGTVTDKATGEPIAGARVGMNWVLIPETTTDAEGRYALHGWTGKGVSDICAMAEGYARTRAEVEDRDVIDFELVSGVRARGRVVDGSGAPIGRAQVMAVGSERGGADKLSMDHAWTDAEGRFVLADLDPELLHVLTIVKPGHAQGMADIPPAGNRAEIDLGDITMTPHRVLAGSLRDEAGTPVARVLINLQIIEPGKHGYRRGRAWERRSDDLGRFRFENLPPGRYTIATRPVGGGSVSRQVEVLDRDEPTVVALVQAVTREVRILVTTPEGEPVQDTWIRARTGQGNPRIQGQTDAAGQATLLLPSREARLTVTVPSDQPYTAPPAHVIAATENEATIVLQPAAMTRGRLLDPQGKPIAWGRLLAHLPDGDRKFAFTDESGSFRVRTEIDVVMDIEFDGHVGPSRNRRFQTEPTPMAGKVSGVRAGASDVIIRSKAVARGGKVVIRVLDPDGGPVAGLTVHVIPMPVEQKRRPLTDAEGRVTFEDLPVREIRYGVGFSTTREKPWFVPPSPTFTPEGQEIVIRLRTGARIEGVLQTAEGRPTPGYVMVMRERSSAGSAMAGPDGRFVVVVDPEVPGPYTLQSMVHRRGKQPMTARLTDVQPGDRDIELRFEGDK